MTIEQDDDLVRLRVIGRIVANCLHVMARSMEVGMTTRELDAIGRRFLDDNGAESAPQHCYDFPGATCISVNECVAHGIPDDRALRAGDLVNIDVSAVKDGVFADTGASFVVGESNGHQRHVCQATHEALQRAMSAVRAGRPINVVGKQIETVAKKHKLGIVKNLCSHGVGSWIHEEPESILPYASRRERRRLHKGLVMTIEPFLTTGKAHVDEADDGWSLMQPPGTLTAQYEHTMVIRDGRPLVVTIPDEAVAFPFAA